jgi:nitroreductase
MLIDVLRTRRSIRSFTDRPVEPEKVDLLVEAALRAPSSRGRRPWELVVVSDSDTIVRLATAKPSGAELLRGAPLVIVVCADPTVSDVWIEDAAIVTTLIHLEAHDLGLGSCWVQVRLRPHDEASTATEYVAGILRLEPGLSVEAMVGIGYPAEVKPGHPATSLPRQKVRFVGSSQRA